MPLEKGFLSNHTTMSLDERFTQLRRAGETRIQPGARARIEGRLQAASAKSRRLALQMARRPAVIAALSMRRGRGIQRNSAGLVTQGSLLRGTARFGRINSQRGNNRNIRRGGLSITTGRGGLSITSARGGLPRLSRSQSLQSLSSRINLTNLRGSAQSVRLRGRGGGRLSRSSSVGRFNVRRTDAVARRGNNNFRGRNRGGSFRRGNMGGRGGRGGGRGRGNPRGGRRQEANKPPSKEALDEELDQYMSSSRVALDKEIDQYMNQPEQENWD